MKSQKRGKSILEAEVLNVSGFGIWMLILEREYFLSFEDFPWFREASIGQILNFEFLHGRHLYWSDLDVDLSLESLGSPERFPLKSKRG